MDNNNNLKGLKWTETKREFEYDENGNLLPKVVTLEPNVKQRQFRDIIFQTIPILGLVISILIFYLGQRADREKDYDNRKTELNRERGKLQIEYYSELSFQLHTLFQKRLSAKVFDSLKFELQYRTFRKVTFLNDQQVMSSFNAFMPNIERYIVLTTICKSFNRSDSTLKKLSNLMRYLAFVNFQKNNRHISKATLRMFRKSSKKCLDSLNDQYSYLFDIFYQKFPELHKEGEQSKLIDTVYDFRTSIVHKPIERRVAYYLAIYCDHLNSLIAKLHRLISGSEVLPFNLALVDQIDDEKLNLDLMRDSLGFLRDTDARLLDAHTNKLDEITRKNSWLYKETY